MCWLAGVSLPPHLIPLDSCITSVCDIAATPIYTGIMKFAPDKPAWIIDAQDTLDFRTEAMGDQLDSLLAEGKTMEQIHLMMNERLSNAAVVEEATNVRPPLPHILG